MVSSPPRNRKGWRVAWYALNLVLTVVGLGGIPDDIGTWHRWLGMLDWDIVRYVALGLLVPSLGATIAVETQRWREGKRARLASAPVCCAPYAERLEEHTHADGTPYWIGPDRREWMTKGDIAAVHAQLPHVGTYERYLRPSHFKANNMPAIKSARRTISGGLVAKFGAEHPEHTTVDGLVDARAADDWIRAHIGARIEGYSGERRS